jgi:hypothetical protein
MWAYSSTTSLHRLFYDEQEVIAAKRNIVSLDVQHFYICPHETSLFLRDGFSWNFHFTKVRK